MNQTELEEISVSPSTTELTDQEREEITQTIQNFTPEDFYETEKAVTSTYISDTEEFNGLHLTEKDSEKKFGCDFYGVNFR